MKLSVLKALLVLLLGVIPYLGYADVPGTISFQGYLSDDLGKPVNGTTDITFSMPGTAWVELHTGVPVKRGVFSVQLGSQTPFAGEVDFSEMPQWLEIEVNGASRTVPLSSVPYAFHAQTVAQDNDTLSELSCANGQVAKSEGSSWVCADSADTKDEPADTSGWVPMGTAMRYLDDKPVIRFQGYLSDAEGKPVEETTDMTFSIPGTVWIERHLNVPVNQGAYNVQLGLKMSLAEIDFSKGPQLLQIEANDVSQTVPLSSSVPYAFHAKTVELDSFSRCRICILYGDFGGNSGRRMMCTKLQDGADSGFMTLLGDVNYDDVLKMTFRCDGGPSGVWDDWDH